MSTSWDKYRRDDMSIDLVEAYHAINYMPSYRHPEMQLDIQFLEDVERLQPVLSRQAAAIAIAMANVLRTRNSE